MWKSHRKLNIVLFPALPGLCVGAVRQALLWTKRGERRYWLSLLKDDILKWAVKIKRNILVDFQTLIHYMTNISIFQQSKKTFLKLHFFPLFWVFYCDSIASVFLGDPENALNHNSTLKKNQRANVLYLYSYSWAPATSYHRFETFNANMKALKCKMNTSDATRFRKRKFLWFFWGLWKRRHMSKFISYYVSSLLSEFAWLAISSPDFSIHMDIGQPFANGHASTSHDYLETKLDSDMSYRSM